MLPNHISACPADAQEVRNKLLKTACLPLKDEAVKQRSHTSSNVEPSGMIVTITLITLESVSYGFSNPYSWKVGAGQSMSGGMLA